MRLAAALLLLPSSLQACAVCFGQSDNAGLASGLLWGIVVLLGATFFLVCWLVAAVWRIEKFRQAREAREARAHS